MLDKSYERKIKIMSKLDFQTTCITELKLQARGLEFSVLNVFELIDRLMRSRNLKKQCMCMENISLKTPLLIYFNFFPIFFQNLSCQTRRCCSSASAAYTPVFKVNLFNSYTVLEVMLFQTFTENSLVHNTTEPVHVFLSFSGQFQLSP